jgi:single-stranded-DNA-specific exonuclease
MDTAETSLNLLLSRSQEEAEGLAKVVELFNRQRQKIENKIMEEAEALINKEINFKEHKVIVIAKEDWHQGVLGIVAAKLVDRFYRPAIVISLSEDLCKGSGRSIKNFHLFDALLECKEYLNAFGGHSHAAGLVITKEGIEDFKRNINRLAHEKLTLEDLLPSLDIDMELGFADLNEKVISELGALEPFGAGNPEPLFYTRKLKVKNEPQVLSRDTLKFWVTDGNTTFEAIGFGMGGFKVSLETADYFDLVYTPRMDNWRGDSTILLEAKDIFFR